MRFIILFLSIISLYSLPVKDVCFIKHSVFPQEEGFTHFPFGILNSLHIDTKDYFLKRLLPFNLKSDADSISNYDAPRILRLHDFIGDCRLFSIDTINDSIVITYEIREVWTTKPSIDFGFIANRKKYGAELRNRISLERH
jgi:hypothetical protein